MKKLSLTFFGLHKYLLAASIVIFYQAGLQGKAKTNEPPLIPYMDQVIKRKKEIITKKCLKHIEKNTTGFLMIEITVFQKGNTKPRLVATELKNKDFLNCTLSVLSRIQLKEIKEESVSRIYRFFVL